MYSTPQKLIAEFLGTFALIFFGAGSICTDQYLHGAGGLGLLGIALAHGLAFAIMVSALGHISGGHFNPAVTIGFWVTKRVGTIEAFLYSLFFLCLRCSPQPSMKKARFAPSPALVSACQSRSAFWLPGLSPEPL